MFKNTIYLPGLNGLRAIAALAVLISHITLGLDAFGLDNKILGTDMYGKASGSNLAGQGVTIFFTLSGFLICYLLLREKETGRIKIKDFYIRRILRIWPLYYLYLLICVIVILYQGISFHASSIPFYVLLAANIPFILEKALPFLAHYWSLGVEEQFYLFFPQIAKCPNKKMLRLTIILIAGFLALKCFFWVLDRWYNIPIPYLAIHVTRFHTMLIGVAGAILYYQKNPFFIAIATHKITQIISWFWLFCIAINKFHIASVIDTELVSLLTLCLIMGQITQKNQIISLENRICDFIGKISYGIYVIHPLIIYFSSKWIHPFSSKGILNYLIIYSLITGATICFAYLSYEFYEKWFLKMKSRYTTVNSTSIKHGS